MHYFSGMKSFKRACRYLIVVVMGFECNVACANPIRDVGEGARLVYYCKGNIVLKDQDWKVQVTEFMGDKEGVRRAIEVTERMLNQNVFGPKQNEFKVFVRYSFEWRDEDGGGVVTKSGGGLSASWGDRFLLSFRDGRRSYTIEEIESAIFDRMLSDW